MPVMMVSIMGLLVSTASVIAASQTTGAVRITTPTAASTFTSCASKDLNCITSYYTNHRTCVPNDVNCMVSALPALTCVSGSSVDSNCAVSFYSKQSCAPTDINCMVSAYSIYYPGSVLATATAANATNISASPKPSTTLSGATGLPSGVTTMDLNSISIPTTLSTAVKPPGPPHTKAAPAHPAPPKDKECVIGDAECYWNHPLAPAGEPGMVDPADPNDVSRSPIGDDGKYGGTDKWTPLVKLKHKSDNDENSDKCYRALVQGKKVPKDRKSGDFYEENCVGVIHAGVTSDDPHGGRFWYSPAAARYAEHMGCRFPRCIDLRVDTGCGFEQIGWQGRCTSDFNLKKGFVKPYRKVDCSAFAAPKKPPKIGVKPGAGKVPQRPEDISKGH
ncbi:hypothetical protein LTR85_001581 [Meristemomyces frigidus]|nr:hypothetical protein LTR85_001581 [Meristemomyces frigidus]